MRKIFGIIAGIITVIFMSAAPAFAAGPTYTNGQTVAATVVIGESDSLSLTNTSITLSGLVGQHETDTVNYHVLANDPNGYSVTVAAASGSFSGSGSNSFATSLVNVMGQAGGSLSTTPLTVDAHTGASVASPGDAFTDTYSIDVPNVPAGNYGNTITYTLVPG